MVIGGKLGDARQHVGGHALECAERRAVILRMEYRCSAAVLKDSVAGARAINFVVEH